MKPLETSETFETPETSKAPPAAGRELTEGKPFNLLKLLKTPETLETT